MRRSLVASALTLAAVGILAFTWMVGTYALLDGGVSALKAENKDEAFEKLRISAKLGNSTAQELLGKMYAFGWGTSQNDDEAIRWFRRARLWPEITPDR